MNLWPYVKNISTYVYNRTYLNSDNLNPCGIPSLSLPSFHAHCTKTQQTHGSVTLPHFHSIRNLYERIAQSLLRVLERRVRTLGFALSSMYSESIQLDLDRGISSGGRRLAQFSFVSSEHTAPAASAIVSSYSYSPLAYLSEVCQATRMLGIGESSPIGALSFLSVTVYAVYLHRRCVR
jgi:hypothetical protein